MRGKPNAPRQKYPLKHLCELLFAVISEFIFLDPIELYFLVRSSSTIEQTIQSTLLFYATLLQSLPHRVHESTL